MTSRSAPSLAAARLQAAPGEFDFVQAVDLLEQLARAQGMAPVPLGEGSDPSREAVSLRAPFEFGFRPLPLEDMHAGAGGPPRLFVNFLGLAGSDGPLPEPYVDLVRTSLLARDGASADFLGIFQHRLLSYAWRAADAMRCAGPFSAPGAGPLAPALRALAGASDDEARAPLFAHLPAASQARRSLHGLCILLGRCFGMRVSGREAAGRWLDLEPGLRSSPGRSGRNHRLGRARGAGAARLAAGRRDRARFRHAAGSLVPRPAAGRRAPCRPGPAVRLVPGAGPGLPHRHGLPARACRLRAVRRLPPGAGRLARQGRGLAYRRFHPGGARRCHA
ncbi:type VI secretion system baseplate subunit TssG [Massilia sp. Se16.2.3]|nr:type VI secretion system baseplate subunit TssG [Massilia sp. Se16.2.3]QNB00137.1 type VI secretion system baseplate subunit TssG [Massilia sp. Se16.2.3]